MKQRKWCNNIFVSVDLKDLVISKGFIVSVDLLSECLQAAQAISTRNKFIHYQNAAAVVSKDEGRPFRFETAQVIAFDTRGFAVVTVLLIVYNSDVSQWSDLPWVAAITVLGTGAQYGLARAIAAADASFSGPFDFLRMPLSAIAALILFAEWPDLWVWVGTGIVFASIFGLTRDRALFRHRTGASSG